ncbi:hypothetical protein BGV52_21130 [Burkholderia ubonensis]|uniref:hypothetical protein n=1 Tax=Burkholderia ubonensis TaxID=101571 RepID=UPI0008FE690D|nr:hypothetical protein [Burkholderia ubonensis]OJB07303.1 hypothetical protein BGV52_21130 [Burkholderia ubonensis]
MMHITEPLPTDKRARLVFGIDWRAYPVKGGRAERRRYADAFGATHFVEYKVGTELIGGFAMPEPADVKGARLYSGAARIALHDRIKSRPAALVLLQDGVRVHAVFVVRGAVRSDEVLSPETAQARRLEIEQECLRSNLPLATLGAGDQVSDVDESFQASELLANRKAGRIAKVPVAIPTALPVLAIVGTTVFGGLKLMDVLSPPPPPPHVPTYAERYAEAVRSTFSHALPRASALAPALLVAVGGNETVRKGWIFRAADCPSSGYCTMTFRRQGGTFEDFDGAATPAMRPVTFSRDGRTSTARGPAVPKVHMLSPEESSQWPSEQAFIEMLQTPPQRMSSHPFDLRAYGYTVTLAEARPLLVDAPAGGQDGHGSRRIKQGDWTIEGFRWQAPLLAKLPPNMTLESLKVELRLNDAVGATTNSETGDSPYGVHFTAKGKFYVFD